MLEWLQMIFLGHAHRWESMEQNGFLMERCTVCGKTKVIRSIQCQHEWKTIKTGPIMNERKVTTGTYYEKECTKCGIMKEFRL